jgi:hypothetical protein
MAKRPKEKAPKLRPRKNPDGKVKHGVWSLHELLKGDLDGRLAIAKKRNQLEAQYIEHCGGTDALTPPMISLIKRIIHAELFADQAEKAALIGEFDLTDKSYGALASRQERHIARLEDLQKNSNPKGKPVNLDDYVVEKYGSVKCKKSK